MKNYVTVRREVSIAALDWAKKHCPTYITNDIHVDNENGARDTWDIDKIDFFFSANNQGEKEMIMFALKWC